jgi:hypothetical protein
MAASTANLTACKLELSPCWRQSFCGPSVIAFMLATLVCGTPTMLLAHPIDLAHNTSAITVAACIVAAALWSIRTCCCA